MVPEGGVRAAGLWLVAVLISPPVWAAQLAVQPRPGHRFECHFHLLRTPSGLLALDIGRSRGERFLRTFHASDRSTFGIVRRAKAGDETWSDDTAASRLSVDVPGLRAELTYRVLAAPYTRPHVNPANLVDLSLADHPAMSYRGWYEAGGARVIFDDAPGLLSQHFGRGLPEYLYLASVPVCPGGPRLIGALMVQRLGGPIPIELPGAYLMLEEGGRREHHSSLTRRIALEDGALVIRSFWTGRVIRRVEVALVDAPLAHQLEGRPAWTALRARFRVDGRDWPDGLVDANGRFGAHLGPATSSEPTGRAHP